MKVLAQIGAPDETLWPYNDEPVPHASRLRIVFAAATPHKATAYQTAQPDALAHANESAHGLPLRVRHRLLPRPSVGRGSPDRHRPDAPRLASSRSAAMPCSWSATTSTPVSSSSAIAGPPAGVTRGYGYLPFAYVLGQNASDFWTAQVAA